MPKIDAETLKPAAWEAAPGCEWCPPGHGDLYAAISGSGKLEELLQAGVEYMFVSNSDNLGATLDPVLLTSFAAQGMPFRMECASRTEADKKGGHLCVRKADGQLILRESAQCADEDEAAFQDVTKHRFFNTNNLWVHLPSLKTAIAANGGLVPLPMIKNKKTVDPKDGAVSSTVPEELAIRPPWSAILCVFCSFSDWFSMDASCHPSWVAWARLLLLPNIESISQLT